MRAEVLAVLAVALATSLAGCTMARPCESDTDCGSLLCTRDGECHPPEEIRRVQVVWLVRGQGASARSCEGIAALELSFVDSDGADTQSYGNVPCSIGVFTMDRLSARFDRVRLVGFDDRGDRVVEGDADIVGLDAQPRVDLTDRGSPDR